jgi:large subunit ribosomal protein L30
MDFGLQQTSCSSDFSLELLRKIATCPLKLYKTLGNLPLEDTATVLTCAKCDDYITSHAHSGLTTSYLLTFQPAILVMSPQTYFRITLIRSAIGLPAKSTGVLKALGLRKRMATVFHPVTPGVAGQIMKIKELVAVSEVDRPLSKEQVHRERVPDPGFYVESRASERGDLEAR